MPPADPDPVTGDKFGFTRHLASVACSIDFESLPANVLEVTRQCLLDFLGVTIAGAQEPVARIVRDYALADESAGICTFIGHGGRGSAGAAALVNGAAAHALDYDDTSVSFCGHPSVVILPALLALAQTRPTSGPQLMEAYVAGYEVGSRIGAAFGELLYERGFHPTAVVGGLASSVACARLLGLDRYQTEQALGLASLQVAGLKCAFGTMGKPFHAGNAAQIGLRSARLAALGFSGRNDTLECPHGLAATHADVAALPAESASATDGYFVLANLFKYHASCYLTHAAINAVLALKAKTGFEAIEVERVDVQIDKRTSDICGIPDPSDALQTKFSLRHAVAMALQGIDTARLDSFSNESASDKGLAGLRSRIHVDFQSGWPLTESRVHVMLRDGKLLEQRSGSGLPNDDLEFQGERVRIKFLSLVRPVLGNRKARSIAECIGKLDDVGDVGRLVNRCSSRC